MRGGIDQGFLADCVTVASGRSIMVPTTPIEDTPGESPARDTVDLSVVLPAYQAEAFIAENLMSLRRALGEQPGLGRWEIIVVDDGSSDATAHAASEAMADAQVVRLPRNRGKGAAVRAGMSAASGTRRLMIDCDLPYGLEVLGRIDGELRAGADVCIGDRTLPDSFFDLEPGFARRLASVVFTWLVSNLSLRGFPDTQCGVKGFRGEAADFLFEGSTVDGFAFDVEILHRAHKRGLRIARVPVRLVTQSPSSIRLFRDSLAMFRDLVMVPLRYHRRPKAGAGSRPRKDAE